MSNPPIPPPMSPQPPTPQAPLQTLSYSYAQGVGRPGILTAVAVVSIVMAILSFLSALWGAFQTVVFVILPSLMRNLPTPGPGGAATMPAGNPFSNLTYDPVQLALGLSDAVLRLGLSILLAVAAVMVLRDRRAGRKIHLIWAYLRIPVAVLGAAAHYLLMESFMSSMQAATATAGGPPPAAPTALANAMGSVMDFGMAVAYPIGVLIVMHTRRVKDFYLTLGK